MNGYDFDKTIYKKDSSVEFYLFLLKRHPKLFYYFIYFVFNYFLYLIKVYNKIKAKEAMFKIVEKIEDIDNEVNEFWKNKKLEQWYLNQKQDSDIIISASPFFLLQPICKKNNINNLIASDIDKKTGKFKGPNCYGIEKLNQIKKYPKFKKLNTFYSDSKSDTVMLEVFNEFFLVKNNKNTLPELNQIKEPISKN